MPRTLGYHFVKSTYGMWLPGDDRGHWSEAWDVRIGYTEPHMLHPGDPVRLRMAEERMKHDPARLTEAMIAAVAEALGECATKSAGGFAVAAVTIVTTHMHVLIPYSARDIHKTTKWLADQTTKSLHAKTDHTGPVWCKGKWCSYVFDEPHWESALEYIERHNLRAGRSAKPYAFIL